MTAAPRLGVNVQQSSIGKGSAGTGLQLHWSMALEHSTSQTLAALYPESKLQPRGQLRALNTH